MTSPIKQEPIDNSQHLQSQSLPDFKSEYSPDTSPSQSLKTLIPDSPSSKGKSKIVEEEDDVPLSPQQLGTCGVCLLEEGMSLRGFIDSCDHYFCFVCIMEWAKVESRCPICKRRFSTIRRPSKHGVFLSERIVDVPVRDQIYYYNGNATIGPTDPYSQVKCSVCSSSSDEHLLLLCDLCDSAAHSFCVGLGATVPEGDWFCKDCTLSRDEHAKVETDTTVDDNNYNNHNPPSCSNTVRFAQSDASIHDIVRESSTREPTSVDQSEPAEQRSETQSTLDQTNAPNARTLKRCLNVHSRIRVLRENWDGFRGGSLNFSSSFEDKFRTSQSQSTSLAQESTSQNHPYDTDKAWKMMAMATKALGKKSANKNSVPKESESRKRKERLLNDASKARPNSTHFMGLKKIKTELSSSKNITASAQVKTNHCSSQNPSTTSNVVRASEQSSSMAADKNCAKTMIDATFKKKENVKKDSQHENAKSEIQTLVKLNLKLVSRENKLEVDVFKEVARHATHSIMAACGIEPPKAQFRSFGQVNCDHGQTRNRPTSTLMPTSCRECFFTFIKDVVTAIASDRTNSCKP